MKHRFRPLLSLLALSIAALALVACTDAPVDDDIGTGPLPSPTDTLPGTPTDTPPAVDFPTVVEQAPIDGVDVLVRESFPPQYAVEVTSGLPSGCASFHDISVERDGTTFAITVLNLMPAPDAEVACTMIYGYAHNTVELGSDLESGTTYAVVVNGEEWATFEAQ